MKCTVGELKEYCDYIVKKWGCDANIFIPCDDGGWRYVSEITHDNTGAICLITKPWSDIPNVNQPAWDNARK